MDYTNKINLRKFILKQFAVKCERSVDGRVFSAIGTGNISYLRWQTQIEVSRCCLANVKHSPQAPQAGTAR